MVWNRQALQRSGRDFTLIKMLPSGFYQFKFYVDGQWRYSPDLPYVSDDTNNRNNLLDVQVSHSTYFPLSSKFARLMLISWKDNRILGNLLQEVVMYRARDVLYSFLNSFKTC